MGRTSTPTYVVEIEMPGYRYAPAAWRVSSAVNAPGYGKPTDANLARYVEKFEESTRPGGVNAHLGFQRVTTARIRRNTSNGGFRGGVIATYTAPPRPMFEVVAGNLAGGQPES